MCFQYHDFRQIVMIPDGKGQSFQKYCWGY